MSKKITFFIHVLWIFSLVFFARHVFAVEPTAIKVTMRNIPPDKKSTDFSVMVELTFENTSAQVVELDKMSIAYGGDVTNDFFDVMVAGKELEYLGMMAKRGHPGPGGFVKVKPKEKLIVTADIGTLYQFPQGEYEIEAKYKTYNHFSKDEINLESAPTKFFVSKP
jgi:hypothetical protein